MSMFEGDGVKEYQRCYNCNSYRAEERDCRNWEVEQRVTATDEDGDRVLDIYFAEDFGCPFWTKYNPE